MNNTKNDNRVKLSSQESLDIRPFCLAAYLEPEAYMRSQQHLARAWHGS